MIRLCLLLLCSALVVSAQPEMPAWLNPKIRPSPPPKTMGEQMGVCETIGQPALGYEMDGDVKVFTLIAQPVEQWLTDGETVYWDAIPKENMYEPLARARLSQKVKAWGYNGSVPGPTIEVTEGDLVRIIVKNELPEPTSIHWHGLLLPNDQDGAAGSTQYPILPGESQTYEFKIYQSGTFMYHSGFNVTKQEGYGLGGMFICHPKEPEEKIDRDYVILLQEFAIAAGNKSPNLVSMGANWFTFNGHTAPSIPMLVANQEERVRIRFGNLSLNSHPIHIHGYSWMVVGTEGGPIPKSARWPGATVDIAPGQTRDVEFVAWNPGIWRLHCHRLHHILNAFGMVPLGIMPQGGMFTYLHVIPTDPDAPWTPPTPAEVDGGQ